MKPLTKASAIFDRGIIVLAVIAVLLLAFIMLSVSAEVVTRYFVGRQMLWVIEVTEYCLVWIAFLGAACVLKREAHVVMDIVLIRLEPRTQALVNAITSIIGVVICLVVTWYGVEVTLDFYRRGHFLPSVLEPPSFVLYAIIPVGSLLLAIQFVRRTYGYIQGWRVVPDKKSGE